MLKCLKKNPTKPHLPNNKPLTQNLARVKTCLSSQVCVLMDTLLFVELVFRFRARMPKAFRAEREHSLNFSPFLTINVTMEIVFPFQEGRCLKNIFFKI